MVRNPLKRLHPTSGQTQTIIFHLCIPSLCFSSHEPQVFVKRMSYFEKRLHKVVFNLSFQVPVGYSDSWIKPCGTSNVRLLVWQDCHLDLLQCITVFHPVLCHILAAHCPQIHNSTVAHISQKWHSGGCQYSQSDLVPITFQEVFARLSVGWGSFFSTHFYLFVLVAQRMERFLVLILHAHHCRAGNYTWALSSCCPIDRKNLVLFQYHLISCDA